MTSIAMTVWPGTAVLVVKPAKLKEFKQAVARITAPTRLEKGCVTYYGYQVLDSEGKETNRFEFFETWNNKDAMMIDHKEKSAHMQQFFKEIKADTKDSYLESFEVSGKYVQVVP